MQRTTAIGRLLATVSGAVMLASASFPAAAQSNGVVAKVGTVEITEADLGIAMEMYGSQVGDMPDDAKRSVLVDALIDIQLGKDAARAAGLDQGEAFKRQQAFLEGQTLRSLYFEAEIAKRVDDAAIKRAYDGQVGRIPPVQEMRVSHILLENEADATAVIDALNGGGDFATLARERSRDASSKDKGGDLGFAAAGTSLAEIETAVAGLKAGDVADKPVRSPFGYHVVKLEETRTRPAPTLEALAPQLRQALEAQAAQAIMAELRSATAVEKLVPDVQPPEGGAGHQD